MPSAGSDRAWVWTVQADFADEEAKVEQLAIRFKNSESKKLFLSHFAFYQHLVLCLLLIGTRTQLHVHITGKSCL